MELKKDKMLRMTEWLNSGRFTKEQTHVNNLFSKINQLLRQLVLSKFQLHSI